MTAAQLISKLGAAGIRLWLDDEQQLRFKAPKGALTQELKDDLIAAKADVIAFLQQAKSSQNQASIPRLPRHAGQNYNLSYAQQRFWFLDRLEPGNPSLHIPAALHIRGPLNIELLRQSFSQLAERHESLRTSFTINDVHDVQQRVCNDITWQLSENYDLSHLQADEQQTRIQEIMQEEALRPFDLTAREAGACHFLRTRLARLTPQGAETTEHVLLLNMHHIIADGWSVGVLIRELTHIYQALQQGQQAALPGLAIQYVDYAHWQRQWMQSDAMASQLDYWRQQLQQPPVLELPTDFPRPKQTGFHGANVNFELDDELSQQLKQLALTQNTSLFALLLAAFNVLLHRYSGQQDFCTGIPVANRSRKETENLVGCFINLLAIRSQFSEGQNFGDYLQLLQKTLLDAQANQDVPFELVADEVSPGRSMAHTPIFQVLFTMQNSSQDLAFNIPGLDIHYLEHPSFTAKYDLQLHIDEGRNLSGSIEYNCDLFSTGTVERLTGHFTALLRAICAEQSTEISQLQILSREEHTLLTDTRQGWNATAFDYPRYGALHQIIEEQVKRTPDATAIIADGNEQLSYQQLNQSANRLAHELIRLGAEADQVIAVCLNRSANMSIALLAILKAGAAYLPLDPELPIERLNYMLDDAGVSILLSDNSVDISSSLNVEHKLDLSQPCRQENSSENPSFTASGEQLFNVIYTSGSTGKPKGVMVPHQGIINRLQWMQRAYPIDANDRILQKTPYSFDVSVWELFWPLMQGSTLVYAKPFGHKDPLYLRDLIQQQQITVLHFVPSMLGAFLQTEGIEHCRSIRQVFTSGETLKLEHNRGFFKRLGFAGLSNLYGPTEASVDVSYYDCHADENHRSVPIGKPITNIQLHILSENLQPAPIGVAGDLYIGGTGLARGYLNQPELTASTFIDNPFYSNGHPSQKLYKTGDVARYLPDGNIEYLGRSDHQVKLRGLRIELGEIEAALQQLAHVKDVVVNPMPIAGEPQLVAYIVSDENLLPAADYKAELSKHLPDYMLPVAYVALEQIPLSANGKTDRKRLPAVELSNNQQTYIAPRTVTEAKIALFWQELLKIEHIGVEDNFFELGGHSLSATRLVHKVSDEFGTDIVLKQFFEQATIASLAQMVEQGGSLQQLEAQQPITPAPAEAALPLSLMQERLWVIEQITPGSSAYNIPAAQQLSGQLNTEALNQALTEIVKRHHSLRTRIINSEDGNAWQQVASISEFQLQQQDLRGETNPQQAAQQFFDTEANRPFALTGKTDSELLFRAHLLQLAGDNHVLVINMHHIIADGWSISILQKELVELYSAYAQNQTSPLADLNIQYGDFAYWQRNHLNDEHVQQHLNYWLEKLSDAPALLQLPTDRPRPAQQTFNGAMFSQELSQELAQQVRDFSRQQGSTAFNTLLSFYALLLSKYAHQQDICIGTPVAGRERAELQGLIGYFVNAVVIRNRLTGNPSIEELLQRTQETSLEAFAHQDVPIEQVLERLPLERNLSYPPVAQVGFSYIGQDFSIRAQLPGLTVDYLDYEHVVAKYDMTLIIIDDGDSLQANIEYNTDLFDASTIQQLLNHFNRLLGKGLEKPDTAINSISLLSDNERYDACGISRDNCETILPLTPMQHDMVMSQWLNPDSLANTLGYRAELDYQVDADLWQQAINLVAERQSITRTGFVMNRRPYGDLAYQCIYNKVDTELQILDYSSEELNAAEIDQRVDDFIYQPQAYQNGQFIRYGLMRLQGGRTILLLSSHHALLDGVAIVMIAQTTASYYEALKSDINTATLSVTPDNFQQYIVPNRELVDSETVHNFWQKKLAGCEALLFQGQTQPPASARQIVKRHHLSAEHWQDIKQYCRKQRMTPPQYFKLLYSLLIANYCNAEENFYLTEFHAGRSREFAYSLGCFFQPSPFVFDAGLLKAETSINALFDYLRQYRKAIKGYDNLSIGLSRQLSGGNGLQFMFNYYHFFPLDQKMCGHAITCIEMPPFIEGAVQFVVKEHENDVSFDLYYQDDCFDDLQLLQRLELISAQFLQGAETLGQISLLLPKEFIDQVYQWNNTRLSKLPYASLQAQFEQQVAATPEAIAIHDDNGSISYAELNQRANQLAHYLQHLGVGADVRVGICMYRSMDVMVAIWAVIKAGGAYVPIEASYPQQRISYILQESHAHVLLSQRELTDRVSDFNGDVIYLDDSDSTHCQAIQAESTANPEDRTDKQDMLYVIFTSGSTGKPKGATVTHRGEINLQQWYQREFQFNIESRCLIISALGFDLTQKNLFAPLLSGGQLILSRLPHYDSGAIRQLINQHQVNLINCAPSAFYPLVEDFSDYQPLQSLKQVIFGGEHIQAQRLANWFADSSCQAQLINNYGPTECTDIASFYRIENPADFYQQDVPIGKPNDNVQTFIVNRMLQLLPTGLTGEIAISGKGVGRGYLNHDSLNQQKFVPSQFSDGQLYLTGDMGRYQTDGNITFISRKDFQVKLHGLRIELGEIEQLLRQQAGIQDALVLVREEQLVAYLLAAETTFDAVTLNTALTTQLPEYMLPQSYLRLDSWPLTANGKIDRDALPTPSGQVQNPYVAPRNEVEQTICDIVQRILGVDKVGIHDNFFDLGGHSLAASRAIVQIRDHFAVDIPIHVVFDMTTAEKLAEYIQACQWASQSAQTLVNDDSRDTGFI